MKHAMAMTRNVRRFLGAVQELRDRPLGIEGMGLLWGLPGEGKSTTVAFATNKMDGVYLRANSCWTVTSMLQALCAELSLPPGRFRAPMLEAVNAELAAGSRPIFVDEADYLLRQPAMIDALRDVYDTTGSPVILIGMEDMARKVRSIGKFARRVTQWIEFSGIDAADARTLADTVCEVRVDDGLLAHLAKEARANIGRMTTALARIETFARTNSLDSVTLADWGARPLFFDQPEFGRKR